MSEIKHTPTPWRIGSPANAVILGADDKDVALTFVGLSERNSEDDDANAQFIVRACNSHYELLAACEFTLLRLEKVNNAEGIVGDCLRAAIANAKGGEL